MGNKVFILYKYKDADVYLIQNISGDIPIARDYVTWLEKKFKEKIDHIY